MRDSRTLHSDADAHARDAYAAADRGGEATARVFFAHAMRCETLAATGAPNDEQRHLLENAAEYAIEARRPLDAEAIATLGRLTTGESDRWTELLDAASTQVRLRRLLGDSLARHPSLPPDGWGWARRIEKLVGMLARGESP